MNDIKRVVLKPCSKDKFELVKDYEYQCGFGAVNVPKGYITNGANIPRVFWSIYPPNSPEYLSAVVVHDYLCDNAETYEDYVLADNIFFMALKELGVGVMKSALFYLSCKTYHYIKYKLLRRK